MTKGEARRLPNGIYRVWWRMDEQTSVAAVGRDVDGYVWIAPTNWVSRSDGPWWIAVDRVELICER